MLSTQSVQVAEFEPQLTASNSSRYFPLCESRWMTTNRDNQTLRGHCSWKNAATHVQTWLKYKSSHYRSHNLSYCGRKYAHPPVSTAHPITHTLYRKLETWPVGDLQRWWWFRGLRAPSNPEVLSHRDITDLVQKRLNETSQQFLKRIE